MLKNQRKILNFDEEVTYTIYYFKFLSQKSDRVFKKYVHGQESRSVCILRPRCALNMLVKKSRKYKMRSSLKSRKAILLCITYEVNQQFRDIMIPKPCLYHQNCLLTDDLNFKNAFGPWLGPRWARARKKVIFDQKSIFFKNKVWYDKTCLKSKQHV